MTYFEPLVNSFFTLYAFCAHMESHPVPQNVTSFEFHLIGDMTLKQFFYLAIGVGTAYLTFVFMANKLPFVAWPIVAVSAISGIAFAFLPISDRPLDYWTGAFLKAIYSPTKLVWSKNKKTYSEEPIFTQRLNLFLSTANVSAATPIIPTIPIPPSPSHNVPISTTSSKPIPIEALPSKEQLSETVELAKKAQSLQAKILQEEHQLTEVKARADLAQFNTVLTHLQSLVSEAQTIKKQLDAVTGEDATPSKQAVKIEIVKPVKPKATQLSLTSFPNIINGIIKDSQGNYLEGVVVVIYNRDRLPVRALKTNKLGQFTGSTPLPNGTYTIELEKDSLIFDVLQIELVGGILPPLMIAAKKIVGNS